MKNSSRKITRWILAALVLSAAGAAGWRDPAAQETAARPPGSAGWELTVLLPLPVDVPGSGGLRLYAVDELFAVSPEFFLFWGRIHPRKDEFGLFSYKAGTWALLFRDGKAAVPPFLQGPPEKVCMKKAAVFSAPTNIVAGPDRFFILTGERLYSWDGAALRKVWGALADDPGRLQDKYGRVFDVDVDRTGHLLLELSSHSSSGLMFCDAGKLLQPLTPKSPFPAVPGGTISKCSEAVLTEDGHLFVDVEYKDAAGKKAEGIFRWSESGFVKLLAVGDPHPKQAGQTVESLSLYTAFARDQYLLVCNARLYIVDGERWNRYGKGAGYSITTPRFPKSDPDLFAYIEHYLTPGTLQQYGSVEYTRWVFVDLTKGDDLFVNAPLPGADVVRWNYFDEDFSGVLVWDQHKPEKWAFLDFRDLRRGYTQPPAVVAESGKSFTMGQLKAMVAPGRGLVALEDGLYALRKGD
jgi:hypothetical protein